jgi:hypothetical protein
MFGSGSWINDSRSATLIVTKFLITFSSKEVGRMEEMTRLKLYSTCQSLYSTYTGPPCCLALF